MKIPQITGSLCAIAIAALAASAAAQPARTQTRSGTAVQAAPAPASPQRGSNALGAQIASKGATNVAACASCHGANGEGNPAAGFPRIAAQSDSYLYRQLEAYASGARHNPVMEPIAKSLNDAQRRAVSTYYASLGGNASAQASAAAAAASASAAAAAERGARLATVGDESHRIQACANCHGPGGIGQAPAYPYLASQHPSYLEAALGEWKSGARNTDPSGQMQRIAKALSDSDVRAVVSFYSSRPVPPPRSFDIATPWQAPARQVAVTSGPRPAGGAQQQTQGVGTEQGSPMSGAQSQGPGGASGGGSQGSPTGASSTGTSVGGAASAPR